LGFGSKWSWMNLEMRSEVGLRSSWNFCILDSEMSAEAIFFICSSWLLGPSLTPAIECRSSRMALFVTLSSSSVLSTPAASFSPSLPASLLRSMSFFSELLWSLVQREMQTLV